MSFEAPGSPTRELTGQLSQATMSDGTEPTVTVPGPFRILDLPGEILRKIIKETLNIERSARRPDWTPPDPNDITSIRLCDFNISAYGLRCHALPPFGLLFVSKHVSREALATVYQNSTFALFIEVAREGSSDNAFGNIPKLVRHITPTMRANAGEVTFHISTIAEALLRDAPRPSSPDQLRTMERALQELQVLVDDATFPHVKAQYIVLETPGLCQKHLDVIFKLFAGNRCLAGLEEVCSTNRQGTPTQETGAKAFGEIVEKAAVASGQQWMLTRVPRLEKDNVTSKTDIWRTASVKWARLRIWNKFVTSGGATTAS